MAIFPVCEKNSYVLQLTRLMSTFTYFGFQSRILNAEVVGLMLARLHPFYSMPSVLEFRDCINMRKELFMHMCCQSILELYERLILADFRRFWQQAMTSKIVADDANMANRIPPKNAHLTLEKHEEHLDKRQL
uniref:Uncharacterized protein n=1 Tax=Romanomermis culicivorax TaxID=13658 RepID=A0A915JVR6_ROMCU